MGYEKKENVVVQQQQLLAGGGKSKPARAKTNVRTSGVIILHFILHNYFIRHPAASLRCDSVMHMSFKKKDNGVL